MEIVKAEKKEKRPYLTKEKKELLLAEMAVMGSRVRLGRVPARVLNGSHQVACQFKQDVEELNKLVARISRITPNHSGPKLLKLHQTFTQQLKKALH